MRAGLFRLLRYHCAAHFAEAPLILGLVLLIAALGLRSTAENRYIRGRLVFSATLFAGYLVLGMIAAYGRLGADALQQLHDVAPLLVALGLITVLVSLALNPWRVDRMPDRFPHILQDTIIVALFALAATFFMREKVLTTTAVGAVVIGFALQDTLGNLFAGLAIQIEKPFRVGDWVGIGEQDGMVTEITWRATKLRTKAGNFVIVPNSILAKDTIANYSQPTTDTRLDVDIGASYDTPPNEVKATILEAIGDEPLIAARRPEVLVWDFGASAITYRVRVWASDYAADSVIRDRVRTAVYYAFRRRHIEIPYPIQVEYKREFTATPPVDLPGIDAVIAAAEIFKPLTAEQRWQLIAGAHVVLYAAGEVIVRQRDPGSSMFVVVRGEAIVSIEPGRREVARVGPGGFFGEVSLLTGDPRTATVAAVVDCELVEITADAFRVFILNEPRVLERITTAVAVRRQELQRHTTEAQQSTAVAAETPASLLNRVRRFLRLTV